LSALTSDHLQHALNDSESEVRRTAAEFAAPFHDVSIHHLIDDADVFVAEMAAWSLGERVPVTDEELQHLIDRTTSHDEPVVREACAAALGSIGDERGLLQFFRHVKTSQLFVVVPFSHLHRLTEKQSMLHCKKP
jgi:HEAT repeat protein